MPGEFWVFVLVSRISAILGISVIVGSTGIVIAVIKDGSSVLLSGWLLAGAVFILLIALRSERRNRNRIPVFQSTKDVVERARKKFRR